jgi:hypothetical protein
MLAYLQVKYPVSSGIELREDIDGYLNGFRASLGVALLNQAWLAQQFAPNQLYDAEAERNAQAAVTAIYAIVGAPYPHPSAEPSGFIHRVGADWAMVDASRPQITGEAAKVWTQDRGHVISIYDHMGVGVPAPGGQSIEAHMAEHGVKNWYADHTSVRVDQKDLFFACRYDVNYNSQVIAGNRRVQGHNNAWNGTFKGTFCGTSYNKVHREADGRAAEVRAEQKQNHKAYYVTDVSTNAYGLPALMDERSIESYRDGIFVDAIDRGDGDRVTVSYDANGYDWMQIRNPENGNVHYTGPNISRTQHFGGTIQAGALELVQGDRIENRSGAGSIVAKERTVVFTNPGTTTMNLSLQPF